MKTKIACCALNLFLMGLFLSGCAPAAPAQSTTVPATIAVTTVTEPPTPPIIIASPTPTITLPRSLYYLAMDSNRKYQIFRIGRDIITKDQMTFETNGIKSFDVSPVDGSLVYYSGNQLILSDSRNGNREVIFKSIDPSIKSWNSTPRFSPDGQIIAYGQYGNIFFYSTKSEISTLQIGKDSDNYDLDNDSQFSPDGSKLIVHHPNIEIFDTATKEVHILRRLPIGSKGEIFGWCNDATYWSYDSKNVYFADWTEGDSCVSEGGLFRFSVDGTGISLFPVPPNNTRFQGASIAAVWQEINGEIIYLFSCQWPSYSLVQSKPDAIENQIELHPENFHVSLMPPTWTPDGDFLVLVQANDILKPLNNI